MAICDRCGCDHFYWQDGFVIHCLSCNAPQREIYQQWRIVSTPNERYVELLIQASPEFDATPLAFTRIPFECYDLEESYQPYYRYLPPGEAFNPNRLLSPSIRLRIALLDRHPFQFVHTRGWRVYHGRFPILAQSVGFERFDGEFSRDIFVINDPGNGERTVEGNTTTLKFVVSAPADPLFYSTEQEERVEVRTFGSDRFAEEVVIRRAGNDYFRQSEAYIVREIKKARPDACVGCANYYGQTHNGNTLICAMHPYGWTEGDCPDWEKGQPKKSEARIESTAGTLPSGISPQQLFVIHSSNGSGHYILDGHNPFPCADPVLWATWFESADRHVARDEIGDVTISTVFLGLDHNFGFEAESRPVLFETMVFNGDFDEETRRYCTWDEAAAGHRDMVEMVKFEMHPVRRIRRKLWQTLNLVWSTFSRLAH